MSPQVDQEDFGIRSGETLSGEQTERIYSALESDTPAYSIDWRNLPSVDDLAGRLEVMATIKALVPGNNMEIQKDIHNSTVENHIKLLLEAAGTRDNLEAFLDIVERRLSERPEQAADLARQAFLIWAPAAEILGAYDRKQRIEGEAFEIMFPGEKTKITETYLTLGGDKALYTAVERYSATIREAIDQNLPHLSGRVGVTGRRKSYFSVWRKCARRQRDTYDLPDFVGVRVVVNSGEDEASAIADCYAVVGEISQLFEPDLERYKDYIAHPKPNGYQSFHMTLGEPGSPQLEVQVRTTAMHDRAERHLGISRLSHDVSKITPGLYHHRDLRRPERTYRWREAAAQEIAQSDGEIRGVPEGQKLIFAPDGNLYALPEDATALDFSFRIHSRRALRTKLIYINDKLAAFTDRPELGDCVRVEYTSDRIKKVPTWKAGWLDMVETPRAKRRIRKAIKEDRAEQYQQRGLKEIATEFPELRDPLAILTPEDWQQLTEWRYGLPNRKMILREIGAGTVGPGRLVEAIRRRLKELKKA